jgi:hypothetical protein
MIGIGVRVALGRRWGAFYSRAEMSVADGPGGPGGRPGRRIEGFADRPRRWRSPTPEPGVFCMASTISAVEQAS